MTAESITYAAKVRLGAPRMSATATADGAEGGEKAPPKSGVRKVTPKAV